MIIIAIIIMIYVIEICLYTTSKKRTTLPKSQTRVIWVMPIRKPISFRNNVVLFCLLSARASSLLVLIRFCTFTSLSNAMSTKMIKYKLMKGKHFFQEDFPESHIFCEDFLDLCCCNAPDLLSASWR